MNYIIFDLEATCWKSPIRHRQEIIEIDAIKINEEFQIFVKASWHSSWSPLPPKYCFKSFL